MDANDLASAVALRASLPRDVVDRVLCAFQETVFACLRRNEDVSVAGFGVWHRPVRHEATPDFEFVVPVGPFQPSEPSVPKEESSDHGRVRSIAHYLMLSPVLEETFGAGRDPFPDLDARLHPGVLTMDDVYAASMSGYQPTFTPLELAERVVVNMGRGLHA